ncbi:protein TSS [Fagus crenata]
MKHGYLRYHTPSKERSGFGPPRIMNPRAPEFVPGRAWQSNPSNANYVFEMSTAEEEKVDDESNNDVKDDASKKKFPKSQKLELARQVLPSFIIKSV